jgi:hypothetical protein
VNRLEEETRIGKAGIPAAQLSWLDVVVPDKLGYLPLSGPRSVAGILRAVSQGCNERAVYGGFAEASTSLPGRPTK